MPCVERDGLTVSLPPSRDGWRPYHVLVAFDSATPTDHPVARIVRAPHHRPVSSVRASPLDTLCAPDGRAVLAERGALAPAMRAEEYLLHWRRRQTVSLEQLATTWGLRLVYVARGAFADLAAVGRVDVALDGEMTVDTLRAALGEALTVDATGHFQLTLPLTDGASVRLMEVFDAFAYPLCARQDPSRQPAVHDALTLEVCDTSALFAGRFTVEAQSLAP